MRWAWVGKRFGRVVPLAQVTVQHTLAMSDVAQILCGWAVSESDIWLSLMEAREPVLPDLKASKINEIVKRVMEEQGTGVFESYWADDINQRQSDIVTAWSREQCRAVWPKQSAESWGKGS